MVKFIISIEFKIIKLYCSGVGILIDELAHIHIIHFSNQRHYRLPCR